MKSFDRLLLIGSILILVGIVWAFMMNGIGTLEWMLLLSGIVLGILAGMIQGWAVARKKRGNIGSGKMILWVVGAIIVLIAVKVAINVLIPSHLATTDSGIYLSIVYAIGGLLLGRSIYSHLFSKSQQELPS